MALQRAATPFETLQLLASQGGSLVFFFFLNVAYCY